MKKTNLKLLEIVDKFHGNCREVTRKKLAKKLTAAKTTWAKKNNTTPEEIEERIINVIGSPCKYCFEIIDAKNISIDHDNPLSRGGENDVNNIRLICKRCNVRKGKLNGLEYSMILKILRKMEKDAREYILNKLSLRGFF